MFFNGKFNTSYFRLSVINVRITHAVARGTSFTKNLCHLHADTKISCSFISVCGRKSTVVNLDRSLCGGWTLYVCYCCRSCWLRCYHMGNVNTNIFKTPLRLSPSVKVMPYHCHNLVCYFFCVSELQTCSKQLKNVLNVFDIIRDMFLNVWCMWCEFVLKYWC